MWSVSLNVHNHLLKTFPLRSSLAQRVSFDVKVDCILFELHKLCGNRQISHKNKRDFQEYLKQASASLTAPLCIQKHPSQIYLTVLKSLRL